MIIPGSVCKSCYARKGSYVFKAPAQVRAENHKLTLAALHSPGGRKRWVATLAQLITNELNGWFRWHDSGDLLSAQHFRMICEVCELTPNVQHWLPTREYKFVELVSKARKLPPNLTVRLSAHMVGATLPAGRHPTSSLGARTGFECPATYEKEKTNGECGDCRACWDKRFENVDYKKH